MRIRISLRRFIAWAIIPGLTVLGAFSLRSIAQGPGPEVVLVKDSANHSKGRLGERLSAAGVRMVEDYGSFALVSATPGQRAALERDHLDVTAMPDRARTGRGSFFFDTRNGEPVMPANLRAYAERGSLDDHYIVQFVGPIKQEWLKALDTAGAERFDYLPSYSFIVAMQPQTAARVRNLPFVQWVGSYHPGYKLAPSLLTPDSGTHMVSVSLFHGQSSSRVESLLAGWGAAVTGRWDEAGAVLLQTALPSERVLELARLPEVSWMEEYATPALNNSSATWVVQSNVNGSRSIHNKGIRGQSQIIAMGDGVASTTHPALTGKVTRVQVNGCTFPPNADFHGTFVASVLAGDYLRTGQYSFKDGHAPAATLIDEVLGQDGGCNTDLYTNVYPLSVSNNAWVHAQGAGTTDLNCTQRYCDGAAQNDHFVWENKEFLVTMAAGNVGDGNAPNGSINCQAQAKDLLTVGASWNGADADKLADYSSRGPACDGRLKPTVIAPGGVSGLSPLCAASDTGQVYCDGSGTNKYVASYGTSFSHPAVAGSAALVRQYFTEGWYPSGFKSVSQIIPHPSAALVKAVLINSAVEMTDGSAFADGTSEFPNRAQGWGRILLDNALYFGGDARRLTIVDESPGIATSGGQKTYQFQVTPSSPVQPVKVTLVWSDYPGTTGAGVELVNNLDLVVKDGNCDTYNGNHFSTGESTVGGSGDTLNVEEAVIKNSPIAGPWTITVNAPNIVSSPQPFALAITGNVGAIGVTNPNADAMSDYTTQSSVGTIVSGSYLQTQVSDDSREVLQEALLNGVSRLDHVWRFEGVPCRTNLTLRLEGQRPANSDGDNFKFYWSETPNGTYTLIPSATISLPFEPQGGFDYPFTWPGTHGIIYIKVMDTNQASGTSLDQVKIDYLEVR